jgi:triacylglycerol lipase
MYFPKGFDTELSIELGGLIKLAYEQFDAFENETAWTLPEPYGLEAELHHAWTPERALTKGIHSFDVALQRLPHFKKKDSIRIPIGFVARRMKRRYLILRGTQTSKEWLRNFNIDLVPYLLPGHGKVHEGFLQTYCSIRDDLREALSPAGARPDLFIAGHSLGAALATLAAMEMESLEEGRVRAVYTYGSPRVGDDAFVKSFNALFPQRSFRIVNTSDIITSIPLPIPLAGIAGGYFSHVETPVDITVQKDDLKENHGMDTYLSALNGPGSRKGFLGRLLGK